jgi:hypothetical protein
VRPSSTSSSSRLSRVWPRFVLELAIVVAVFFAAEGGTRFAVGAGLLPSPEPLLWHRREVDVKLCQIQTLEAKGGTDVLFVGSSVAYTGVDPAAFDDTFKSVTGQAIVSYNAGLAAVPVSMVDRFVERVFLSRATPRAIILVVSPRDLNSNNPIGRDIVEEIESSAYGQALLGSGYKSVLTRLLLDNSMLFRYRSTIMLTALNGFRIPADLPAAYDDPPFDDRGYVASPVRLPNRLSESPGEVPGGDLAVASLRAFDPAGENATGLERLMRFCQQEDIQLIVVNAPMTRYLAAGFEAPAADYQLYLDTITALTAEYQVPFWDLNHSPWRDAFTDDDFGDIFHLNEQGAQKLSCMMVHLFAQSARHESDVLTVQSVVQECE